MVRNFTDEDRNKAVYTADGTRVGTINEVEEEKAQVHRDEDSGSLTDEVVDLLGWDDEDESHDLHRDRVERYDESGVHLHGQR